MLYSNRPLPQVPPEPDISHLKAITRRPLSPAAPVCSRAAMRRHSDIVWADRCDALASRF